jgi:PAS domain S-box-containing protein
MLASINELSFNLLVIRIESSDVSLPRISQINRSAINLLGYDENELIGKPLTKLFSTRAEYEHWQTACATLEKHPIDNCFKGAFITKDKHIIQALFSLSPLPQTTPEYSEIVILIQPVIPEQEPLLMRQIVEQSASAMMITDRAGRIEYVNPKFTELTGYSNQELLGQNPKILQSGNMNAEHYRLMWETLSQTGEWRGEIQNLRKNGTFYWVYESISAIKNQNGEITHFVAVEEDITRRKKAETALYESEERFRQMADMTGEWLWEQDPDGYYIYSSNAVKQILGYTEEQVNGKHYTEFLTLQDKENQQFFAASQHPFFAIINHYQHKNGHEVLTESTGLPIVNSEGKLIKWRGVDRDITASMHFQEALIESEKRTRLIIESSIDANIILDSYGIITDWNKRAEAMFGWSREEAIGMRLDDTIIPHRFRNQHRQAFNKFLQTGDISLLNLQSEQLALRRSGIEFPAEINVSPLKLGNAYILSFFIHDISNRKAAEEQIRQAQVNLAIAQNEIKIAQQIQASLLPSKPIVADTFEVTGYCLTADKAGGDYFDYFYRNKDQLDMVIADVSGHSVGPALFMVETRSAIRAQSGLSATPSQSLAFLNDFLFEDLNKSDYFITLFYLQADIGKRLLRFTNAGHPPPLLFCRASRTIIELDTEGLLLGIKKDVVFEEKSIAISKGDLVLFYTDGLIEAEDNHKEFFGVHRVKAMFLEKADEPPQKIINGLGDALRDFCQRTDFSDDITLMIFKYQ